MEKNDAIKILERMIEAHERLLYFADAHKYESLVTQIKEDTEALIIAKKELKKAAESNNAKGGAKNTGVD